MGGRGSRPSRHVAQDHHPTGSSSPRDAALARLTPLQEGEGVWERPSRGGGWLAITRRLSRSFALPRSPRPPLSLSPRHAAMGAGSATKVSSPSFASTMTVSPGRNSPFSTILAKGSSTRRWMVRFKGRAP